MYLKALQLRQFRNYQEQQIEFDAPKTILVGNNAQGKSNLLEAVELLSTLRSHRAMRDRDLILAGTSTSQINATIERDAGSVELSLKLQSQGRRTLSVNQESLRRQIDFLGLVNAVQFSSLDLELVRGAPEKRRAWIDSLLVQIEPIYAHILQQYNQVLRQRNALLKTCKAQQIEPEVVADRLALWDAQLVTTGTRVIRRRSRILQRLAPLAETRHNEISGDREVALVRYAPNIVSETEIPEKVQQAFLEKIQQRRVAEQVHGTTLVGPHRDDIDFTINQTPAKTYGSQGQQRTFVLSLKLAELNLIEEVVGEPPLLLLDDVLAELDLLRQSQLIETIQDRFHTFITTTHLGAFDARWLKSSQILTVESGKLIPDSSDRF
jgi:DNA replication and repair protein RecF